MPQDATQCSLFDEAMEAAARVVSIAFQAPSLPFTKADRAKMASNRAAVLKLMLDGRARTLRQIRAECEFDPETEVSARLRDLRKPEYGGYEVKCWRGGSDVYLYQMAVPK